jgi:hypothetical protein
MVFAMSAASSNAVIGSAEEWRSSHAAPRLELEPLTPAELDALFRGGEPEADDCEALLAVDNQVGVCPFHHLHCIHGGYLRVVGRAPDGLRWFLNGKPWAGPQQTMC